MSQAAQNLPVAERPPFGLAAVDAQAAQLPFGLLAQFGRQKRRYLLGLVLLATYQYGQYWFDTRLRTAINLADAHQRDAVVRLGVWMVVVALVAFAVRVLSRVAVFNAGR